jgi:hypothetical protein
MSVGAAASAADATETPASFLFGHELQKIHRIVRILLYTCRKPKHVLLFSLVGRFWREALIDFKLAATVFDRIFDARNEALSEADVKQVWLQAAAILVKQDTASAHSTLPRLDPQLLTEMLSAMQKENLRGGLEYDAARSDPRPRDSSDHAEFAAVCVPHAAAARHRFAQSRGALAAAFRKTPHPLDFFPPPNDKSKGVPDTRACVAHLCVGEIMSNSFFSVLRSSEGFVVQVDYMYQEDGLRALDVSLLPSSLLALDLNSSLIHIKSFDFAALSVAVPRLTYLDLTSCGLDMLLDVTKALTAFRFLEYACLSGNPIRSNDGVDLAAFSSQHLRDGSVFTLDVSGTKLSGVIRGSKLQRVQLNYSDTELVLCDDDD